MMKLLHGNCLRIVFICSIVAATQPMQLHGHATADAHMEDLSHQIEHNPADQMLRLKRAMIYLKQGNTDASWKDLTAAKKLGPEKNLWRFLGHYYQAVNNPTLALQNFDKHLTQAPMDFAIIEVKAELLTKLDKQQEAITAYQFIINNKPQIQPGYFLIIAELVAESSTANFEEAIKIIEQGLERLDHPVQLLRRLIDIHNRNRSYQNALKYNEILIEKIGASPHLLTEKANLLEHLNHQEQAQSLYRQVLKHLQTLRLTPARKKLQEEILKKVDQDRKA